MYSLLPPPIRHSSVPPSAVWREAFVPRHCSMLHCSHCLALCESDHLDDFVCCSSCGKVLGQSFRGKYIDNSKPLLDRACGLKKRKKERKKKQQGETGMHSTDPQLTT